MALVALGSLVLASTIALPNAKKDAQQDESCEWCSDKTKEPKPPKEPKAPKEPMLPTSPPPPEAPAPPPSPPQAPAPPPPPAAPPPTPPEAKSPPPAPKIVVRKSGPSRAVSTGRARFYVKVRNLGNATARGAGITDILPSGFFVQKVEVEASVRKWKRVKPRLRKGRLIVPLGNLRPSQAKRVRITTRLGRAVRGRKCNVVQATLIGAGAVSAARTCSRVVPPRRTKTPPRVTG